MLNTIAEGVSLREAEEDWGVPKSTLSDQLNSRVSQTEAQVPHQRLSLVQEQRLTEWILTQEALGQSLTYSQIRAFVGRILATRGDVIPLGKR